MKSNNEIILCFGCGHQCHEKCAFSKNNFIKCIICRRKGIENDEFSENKNIENKNEINMNEIKEDKENKINEEMKKKKEKNVFMFGNRDDK